MNSMNVWHWAWVQLLVLLLPMETSTSMLGGGARVLGRSRGQGMRRKRAAAAGIRSSEVSSEICSAPTSMPPPPPSAPPSHRALDICGWQGVRGGDEQPETLGERFLMGRTESVYLGRVVRLLQSSVPFSLSSVGCRTGGDAASDVPPK